MKGLTVLAGVIAFLCMLMGIIIYFLVFYGAGVLAHIPVSLTDPVIWFWISALLFLATIALAVGRGRGEE